MIRTSTNHLAWSSLTEDFISIFSLSTNFDADYVLAPMTAIVHPLFVFKDYGGDNPASHFCALPKRNWTKYFDEKIVVEDGDEHDGVDNGEEDGNEVSEEVRLVDDEEEDDYERDSGEDSDDDEDKDSVVDREVDSDLNSDVDSDEQDSDDDSNDDDG